MNWELNDEMIPRYYWLRRQYSETLQVSSQIVDRRSRQLTVTDFDASVFSVLPPQLPSQRRAGVTKRRRNRSVSNSLQS